MVDRFPAWLQKSSEVWSVNGIGNLTIEVAANCKRLAVVQTSWSCQCNCQWLRAAPLVHALLSPFLSWKCVKLVILSTGSLQGWIDFVVVYSSIVFSPSSHLNFDLFTVVCWFSALWSNTVQAYKSALIMTNEFWNPFCDSDLAKSDKGATKCHTF